MNDREMLDLHIEIQRPDGSENYMALVRNAPYPNFPTRGKFLNNPQLNRLLDLVRPSVSSHEPKYQPHWARKVAPDPAADLNGMGRELFDLLFPNPSAVLDCYLKTCTLAAEQDRTVRLLLTIDFRLNNLPWETIHAAHREETRASKRSALAIVRYLGEIETRKIRAPPGKRAILVVTADPDGGGKSEAISASFRRELETLKAIEARTPTLPEIHSVCGRNTIKRIRETLRALAEDGKVVVGVHFIGHGGVDQKGSFLLGENSHGDEQRLTGDDLKQALEPAVKHLRWVFLNACQGADNRFANPLGSLAEFIAINSEVPSIIAFSRAIDTNTAEDLAEDLYDGFAIQDEYRLEIAIRTLRIEHQNQGGLVLLLRSNKEELSRTIPELVPVPGGIVQLGLDHQMQGKLLNTFEQQYGPVSCALLDEILKLEPQAERYVPSFCMSRTPITNRQFRRFVEEKGTDRLRDRQGLREKKWGLAGSDKEEHPVTMVTYDEALEYCEWANMNLPTLLQWRRAARGDTNRIYPWGDHYPAKDLANIDPKPAGPFSVGSYPEEASLYGILDMAGNVEEWLQDAERRCHKVVGGSWRLSEHLYSITSGYRLQIPTQAFDDLGFRCVRPGEENFN